MGRRRASLACALALGITTALGEQIPFASTSASISTSYVGERLQRYTFPTEAEARSAAGVLEDDEDIWSRRGNELLLRRRNDVSVEASSQEGQDISEWHSNLLSTHPTISTPSNLRASTSSLLNFTSLPVSERYTDPDSDPLHSSYHPYESIVSILRTFANDNPAYARLVSFGHSAEGREILGIKVGNFTKAHLAREVETMGKGKKKSKVKEQGMLVVGTQHAREVRTPPHLAVTLR
jgi:hypothetical protein